MMDAIFCFENFEAQLPLGKYMENKKCYLVFDLSSHTEFGQFGVYTSYELAIKAMKECINEHNETEEDVYLHCFSIDLDDPVAEYEEIANYAEGKWNIREQTQ